ncbi:hypothetical protein EZS27_015148 [termite gut metagenome]|uniref:Uncharacterized protein n=1 Tax=termite gut metagenome TaxID=433724 RepID=A0A5J4RUU1_9ZZZZ
MIYKSCIICYTTLSMILRTKRIKIRFILRRRREDCSTRVKIIAFDKISKKDECNTVIHFHSNSYIVYSYLIFFCG